MRALRYLVNAVRRPEPAATPGLWRTVVSRPRVFDVVSCLLQLRDAGALATLDDAAPRTGFHARVAAYNAGVTRQKVVTTTRRAEICYQILQLPPRDLGRERLLIVGPRNIHELLLAWVHGYRWGNIEAIDLYSTHRKIRIMNMEAMTFPDESFDAVVMANTLAYASDTFQCLSETARVLKPSGRMVFGATYFPGSREWPGNHVSGNEIRGMLRKLALAVTFYHPVDKVNSLGGRQTAHILAVQKADPRNPGFDRIDW